MLDTLLHALAGAWRWLVPWVVVPHYDRGVLLRLGHMHREVGPGLHWIIPFGVDALLSTNVVTASTTLPPQSLTTRDDVEVVLAAAVAWKVRDVARFLLEVEGSETVLRDSACGILADAVRAAEWADVKAPGFAASCHKAIRKRAFRFGVEVEDVALHSCTRAQSIRLWTADTWEATE